MCSAVRGTKSHVVDRLDKKKKKEKRHKQWRENRFYAAVSDYFSRITKIIAKEKKKKKQPTTTTTTTTKKQLTSKQVSLKIARV